MSTELPAMWDAEEVDRLIAEAVQAERQRILAVLNEESMLWDAYNDRAYTTAAVDAVLARSSSTEEQP